jgi:Ca-activated chloride channel family protein
MLPAEQSRADTWDALWLRADQRGAQALQEGNAEAAMELFRDPAWRGTAAWEGGDYAAAAEAFSGLEDADGWYNRGNALAAQGRIDEALAAYRRSLELQPGAEDAQRNIETLEKLRDEQEQQQQQQQQQQQGQQQQDQQDQDQQQNSQGQNQPQDNGSREPPSDDGEQRDQQQDDQQADDGDADEERDGEQPGEQETGEQPQPLSPQIDNSAMQEALERDQALEQWLRRVPDDPSGLLREKFRYESRQRQLSGEQGAGEDDARARNQIW